MLMPAFETLVIASPIMRFVGTSVMPGLRGIARRTANANDIIDIDIDPYLLRQRRAAADGRCTRADETAAQLGVLSFFPETAIMQVG
jgi:hypothetical protein